METKINIAGILKDKPKGTKLYSSACGKCELKEADDKSFKISFYSSKSGFMNGGEGTFDKNGNLYDDGECIVFPSKEMRDWLRFTWKKGDVLQHSEYPLTVIFESFEDDTYTSFKCKYCFNFESASKWLISNSQCSTKHFYKVSEEEAKEFIRKVELNYNGKLNLETLEIEKAQPEFEDGDVLFVRCEEYSFIEIFNYSKKNGDLYDHASLNATTQVLDISGRFKIYKDEIVEIRLATEEEKQLLFDALAKEGKAWDAEKKIIVDLKHKMGFKPFDKVIVFDETKKEWKCDIFSNKTKDANGNVCALCIGGVYYNILPYEGNEHLLVTTNSLE